MLKCLAKYPRRFKDFPLTGEEDKYIPCRPHRARLDFLERFDYPVEGILLRRIAVFDFHRIRAATNFNNGRTTEEI